ncbi:MAG: DUF3147 family protein [Bacillota bacterium]|nr:DUF3147 family protein [Bacillota bacterium]
MDLLIRFLVGGTAVMLSYLVTIISPWKLMAGIFAAFPAVMITAILMVGIASGSKKAATIARGSVYGMVGGIVCVVTVLMVLEMSGNWFLSIIAGLVLWLGSSTAIYAFKDVLKNKEVKKSLVILKK